MFKRSLMILSFSLSQQCWNKGVIVFQSDVRILIGVLMITQHTIGLRSANIQLSGFQSMFMSFVEIEESSSCISMFQLMSTLTRCLKITEKVSYNNVSEARYVYILSGQKLLKKAKNGQFWRVFENLKIVVKQCYQTGHF